MLSTYDILMGYRPYTIFSTFTISLWAAPVGGTVTDYTLFSFNGSTTLLRILSGNLQFVYNNVTLFNTPFVYTNFAFIVVRANNNIFKLTLNNTDYNHTHTQTAPVIYTGFSSSGSTSYKLNSIKLYSRYLTDNEVTLERNSFQPYL